MRKGIVGFGDPTKGNNWNLGCCSRTMKRNSCTIFSLFIVRWFWILGFKGWYINGQRFSPMHYQDYDICSLLTTCHDLDGSIASGPMHRSNGPKQCPNQCMNARFQVAEKINSKIKKKLLHKWPIPIASGTW